ncbi:hypothetical protein M1506_02220 [Patescibacteria group bacterium]|nr:hypothetical protein [Patescibacteria group bacterium]
MFKELFHFKKEGESEEEKRREGIEWQEGSKSHLKKGVRPIMACVEAREQLEKSHGAELEEFLRSIDDLSNSKIVNYYGSPRELQEQNFGNGGVDSYVISTVDGTDKLSTSFRNCTGVAASGVDKETGENISFLSHEDPRYFLSEKENSNRFAYDLEGRLRELKERSAEGTIDAVIIGGNYYKPLGLFNYVKDYKDSIKFLSKEIAKVLGFEPMVMTGPKVTHGIDNVFLNNKERRLYLVRPEVGNETTENYMPSDLEEQRKKWPIRD